MKIGRRRTQLLLFLLASIITSEATDASLPREALAKNFAASGSLGEVVAASGGSGSVKSYPVGTEHAPVDGRDGMPHDGPFVETTAERTRKKTQGLGYDDDAAVDKSTAKATYKDQYSDAELPQSNDAVMDDRLRSNPAEGTRGVEGGISGKSKEAKYADKKPDPPKDARPLPHSETGTIKELEGLESKPVVEEEPKKVLAVSRMSFDGFAKRLTGL